MIYAGYRRADWTGTGREDEGVIALVVFGVVLQVPDMDGLCLTVDGYHLAENTCLNVQALCESLWGHDKET
ncbi:hypothetical protein SDC9_164221 [bioreactor metagenome]|uniref:Uncharacterized protein n=1 Tax=bioreactor metagenome TaxID=1076179 RepID=A0A645FYA8_9ZZZZ